ncbi:unnamed protein product [Sympodiomycopsis kandeliae]
MDEVLPGLWVGDLACALSTEYLSLAGITHIITALKQRLPPPPTLPCGRDIPSTNLLHVPVDDEEHEPILVHFPIVNDFISSVLKEEWIKDEVGTEETSINQPRLINGEIINGHWETTGSGTILIHCQAGCSRSVALTMAYIMSSRQLTVTEAFEMVRNRRSQSEPNTGFLNQLELYYKAKYQIDLRHAPIRRFLMSKINVLNGDSVEDVLMSYYPSPTESPLLSPQPQLSQTRSRRSSRSSMDDNKSISQKLALSPAMPINTDELFRCAAEDLSIQDSSPSPSNWATSISSPFEVLIARSNGNKFGSNGIKGFQPRVPPIKNSNHPASSFSSSNSLPKPLYRPGTMRLRCKICRREIAARDHIVEHEPGQGIEAFDIRRRNKELKSGSKNDRFSQGTNTNSGQEEASNGNGESSSTSALQTGEQSQQESNSSTGPGQDANPVVAPAAAEKPSQHNTQHGRPIKSAASLTASLPPHLAALRAGRNPPTIARPAAAPQSTVSDPSSSSSSSSQPHSLTTTNHNDEGSSPAFQPPSLPSQARTILHSSDCSAYFLEPLDWMYKQTTDALPTEKETGAIQPTEIASLSSGLLSGKLFCPNSSKSKCNAKLGNWDWAGIQCGCGAWVTPAFAVARGRVDEVWD